MLSILSNEILFPSRNVQVQQSLQQVEYVSYQSIWQPRYTHPHNHLNHADLCTLLESPPHILEVEDVISIVGSSCTYYRRWKLIFRTLIIAVLDLKSYEWCKMNNWSHSTSARSREHVSSCSEYKGRQWNKYREWCTEVDILHITVTYVTATINRQTRKGEPETGTDRSSQTRQNPRVD